MRMRDFLPKILSPKSKVDDVLFDMTHHVLTKDIGEHEHDCVEIVVVVSGRATHVLNHARNTIKEGNIFIILPNNAHYFCNCSECEVYNISCTPVIEEKMGVSWRFLPGGEDLFRAGQICPSLYLSKEVFLSFKQLVVSMFSLYCQTVVDKQIKLRSLFTLCLTYLSQVFADNISDGDRNTGIDRVIRHINDVINSDPNTHISLNELKDIACLSKSQLIRAFKQEILMTPLEYILNQRMKIACKLLVHSSLDIGEIAFKSGFADSNYFSRQFKKRVGMSPREFQNNHIFYGKQ